MEKQSSVQSLERALGLLELLSMHTDGMQLVDVAERSGLHKSTAHRLLSALIALGYVERADTKYKLTFKVVELGGRVAEGSDVLKAARAPLERLRDLVSETVHLVVREDTHIVYIYKSESMGLSYRMASRIGLRREMYCTAAGKSILAQLSDDEVREIWAQTNVVRYTDHTIMTLDALLVELADIRKNGYALDNQENELDVRCIACALTDYTGRSNAAFSISAPLVRMTDERIEKLVPEVLAIRRQISAAL